MKNFIASAFVFIFLFSCASAVYADAADDLREEIERQLGDNSMDIGDWVERAVSEDISVDIGPENEISKDKTSGDKSGDKSEDKKSNDKVVWAQEPSQLAITILIYAEMKTLQTIEEDQEKMLKKWNAAQIEARRNKILKNIENGRDILAKSPAFNHYAKDIDAKMKARYPDWKEKMTIDEMAKRINERNNKWKESLKVYLKSMNATTAHLDDDLAMRDELLKIIKKPEGQVQALQAIGGYFDHMNMMLTRDEQTIQSLMTVMTERRLDAQDERNDLDNAVKEAGTSVKKYRSKSKKKCKVGF